MIIGTAKNMTKPINHGRVYKKPFSFRFVLTTANNNSDPAKYYLMQAIETGAQPKFTVSAKNVDALKDSAALSGNIHSNCSVCQPVSTRILQRQFGTVLLFLYTV